MNANDDIIYLRSLELDAAIRLATAVNNMSRDDTAANRLMYETAANAYTQARERRLLHVKQHDKQQAANH